MMGKVGCRGGRSPLRTLGTVLMMAGSLSLLGCQQGDVSPVAEKRSARPSQPQWSPDPQPDLCAERVFDIESENGESPTPVFDQHRAEILARARSVPVVFHTRPKPPQGAPDIVSRMRASLEEAEDPAHAILEVLRKTRGNYPLRRQIFLSDHYLYAETPVLALRLSQVLRLDHLFSKGEGRLIIQRGTETLEVTRQEGQYFLPPIPDTDPNKRHHERLASLLLFDRVRTVDEEFGPTLHVDLQPLQRQLGFSSANIRHFGKETIVADLSVYGTKSTAVFTWEGPEARLECETPGATPHSELAEARFEYHLDQQLIDPIMEAAHEMIFRRLPFDEPKTEEGQQDGLLRLHFKQAYRRYQNTYEFNGDSYYVFDGYGRPRVPQVCIDFITDAFDWGTGGYWPERGESRNYRKGALNFGSMGMENARSVENLAEFASAHPEWFDVYYLPKEERIKFRHRTKFFEHLARDATRYRRGDIVFIYGLRDDGKFHYHSFLVDEKDPVTAMPTVVVANAGPPQARSWEGEMQNAPMRSIVTRVRVRREILKRAHEQARENPGVPLGFPSRDSDDEEGSVARARSGERAPDRISLPRVAEDRPPVSPLGSGGHGGKLSAASGSPSKQSLPSPPGTAGEPPAARAESADPRQLRKEPPRARDGSP